MLRVGLTGGLGSGKSTAARIFASLGAHVLYADTIGRELMEPGQAVHAAIAAHFGNSVLLPDGRLDRPALAKIAFADGRVEELNAIVHPATIARQTKLTEAIFQRDPAAVVIVESALIFETRHKEASQTKDRQTKDRQTKDKEPWRKRFDRLILVTAPEEIKIARFVARSAAGKTLTPTQQTDLEAEAHRRLAQQISDEQKSSLCDYVITNDSSLQQLEWQIDQLWPILQTTAEENRKATDKREG
jgi:dephospho-CoA kinase